MRTLLAVPFLTVVLPAQAQPEMIVSVDSAPPARFGSRAPFTGTPVFVAQASPTTSADLRLPYYDWNACPFECCVYRTWKAKTVVRILRERRLDSPIAFELRSGEAVQAFTGVVVTTKSGAVTALRDGAVGQSNIPVRAGETILIIRPEGEGFWKIWFKGSIDSEELLNLDDASDQGWKFVRRPEFVWWVKLRTSDGRVGWTTATQDFDGTDACG